MINLGNIHSVSEFQRNAKDVLGKLRATKSPIVLTVNGRAAYVVQDAESYQALIDKVQAVEDSQAIREGLRQSEAGQLTSLEDFVADFESRNGL